MAHRRPGPKLPGYPWPVAMATGHWPLPLPVAMATATATGHLPLATGHGHGHCSPHMPRTSNQTVRLSGFGVDTSHDWRRYRGAGCGITDGIMGAYPWPVAIGTNCPDTHGQWPWPAAMASGHGQWPWPVAMASGHGQRPWPLAMAIGHGLLIASMYNHLTNHLSNYPFTLLHSCILFLGMF